jgi:hypothetical protein
VAALTAEPGRPSTVIAVAATRETAGERILRGVERADASLLPPSPEPGSAFGGFHQGELSIRKAS